MHEITINLHMHTTYSDGFGSHSDIAHAAVKAGIDAVIVTDHNVLVEGKEEIIERDGRRLLLLIGEEVHDQARSPQKNHLLVFGAGQEVAQEAWNAERLVKKINKAGGLSFIAHPIDPPSPAIGEVDISWEDWDIQGFTGIELWNGMSEFKSLLKTKLHAVYYAYQPHRVAHGPLPAVLKIWDDLLAKGKRIVAVGGSDAHAFPVHLGPLRRVIFPYEFHFRAINTHLLVIEPLNGELEHDRSLVLNSLASGCAFVGYDLPVSTRGFRFSAHGLEKTVQIGDEISSKNGVTLQIKLPHACECRLIKNGRIVMSWENRLTCTHITSEPGVYRVEAYVDYKGRQRGWIFSNPIYIR
ncbi:MAG: hypothetical protein A2Z16_16735 [Chloroflexi bacterium RBG_16_54_18]|nr:MAG: hypothetical protein A2Z16_16735 [Chloroflexi bacterium RBG_16_54_18]